MTYHGGVEGQVVAEGGDRGGEALWATPRHGLVAAADALHRRVALTGPALFLPEAL